MLALVVQNHPNRTGPDFRREFVRRLACHGSHLLKSWSLRQSRGGSTYLYTDSSITASPAIQASTTLTERGPIVPAPETRPTTIEGWTVLDVRGGTAVLEGPDGVRMATRGDTVPGIGRIDSIVRWGNRWIVATAS